MPRYLGSDFHAGPGLCAGKSPIPDEIKPTAQFAVVSKNPGDEEVKWGAPMVGGSGKLMTSCLMDVGIQRSSYDVLNAVLCMPPGGDLGALIRRAKRDGYPSPVDCCRPRLLRALDAKGHTRVITMGVEATRALTHTRSSISAVRGGPVSIPWSHVVHKRGSGGVAQVGDELVSTDGPVVIPRGALESTVPGGASSGTALPSEERVLQVLPTFNPAFVARARRWLPVFMADLRRAVRFFTGTLQWTEPTITVVQSAEQLRHWLLNATQDGARPPFWTWDYETTWADPLVSTTLCLGIGTRDEAMVIPFVSCEGDADARMTFTIPGIEDVVRWFFTDVQFLKVGWNSGYFDTMVTHRHFGVPVRNQQDGILWHRAMNNELPHALGVVGSMLTDVHAWKNDADGNKLATDAKSDAELWKYNGLDCVVTARAVPAIAQAVAKRQAEVARAFGFVDAAGQPLDHTPVVPSMTIMEVDHRTQEMCAGMHRNGMWVDQRERQRLEDYHTARAVQYRNKLVEIADAAGWRTPGGVLDAIDSADAGSFDGEDADSGLAGEMEELNPGSYDQIRDLLYDVWKLIPVAWTDTGLPATNGEAMREHLQDRSLEPLQREFLDTLRRFRRTKYKYLSTYILKMRLADSDGHPGRVTQIKGKVRKDGSFKWLAKSLSALCWPSDGRVRPTTNAHVTNVGRLSQSGPNNQNIPSVLRSMFGPPPGMAWITCDLDQAHLKVIANRWGIGRLLHCFLDEPQEDAHLLLARDLFGERLTKAKGYNGLCKKPDAGTDAEKLRDINKTLRYAGAYQAAPETIYHTMLKAENKAGDLIYLDLEQREVELMHEKWMTVEPEWQTAWKREVALWRKFGFIADPVLGRRCDFTDSTASQEDVTAITNYAVLSAEAGFMAVAQMAVMDAIPFECWGPGTGIVQQVHDELIVECPPEHAERVRQIVQNAMTIAVPGWPVTMTSKGEIVGRWKKSPFCVRCEKHREPAASPKSDLCLECEPTARKAA